MVAADTREEYACCVDGAPGTERVQGGVKGVKVVLVLKFKDEVRDCMDAAVTGLPTRIRAGRDGIANENHSSVLELAKTVMTLMARAHGNGGFECAMKATV